MNCPKCGCTELDWWLPMMGDGWRMWCADCRHIWAVDKRPVDDQEDM